MATISGRGLRRAVERTTTYAIVEQTWKPEFGAAARQCPQDSPFRLPPPLPTSISDFRNPYYACILFTVDDKHVPLCRIIWVSDLPHYCGGAECQREGLYEIRLEQSETVWANQHRPRRGHRGPGSLADRLAQRRRRRTGVIQHVTFEDGRFRWRETYFVLFPLEKRPTLKLVQKTLRVLNKHYVLSNLTADEQRPFRVAYADFARRFRGDGICFTGGEEVVEQIETLVEELRESADATQQPMLKRCDITKAVSTCCISSRFPSCARRRGRGRRNARSRRACWPCWARWPRSPTAWPSTHSREPSSATTKTNEFEETMLAKDIKNGSILNYNGAPCMVESITVQSPSARGAATFYKYRARNLITKQKVDITLRGGESLDEADFRKRAVKFMYSDATHMHFLDQEDYNQYSLPKEDLVEESKYLTEDWKAFRR